MRKRKEIEEDLDSSMTINGIDILAEVLLDIRDLLERRLKNE